MTTAYAGLRLNELRTLKWSDLDLQSEPPTVTVRAENSKSKCVDIIPLNAELAEALREWQKKRRFSEYVFYIPRWYIKYYRRDLEAAGIPIIDDEGRVVDFHSLRHTYATLLSLAGVPPRQAQAAA